MKPILFNSDMVRTILDGRKTVTRLVVKPQPIYDGVLWRLGGAGWSDTIHRFTPIPCHSLYNRMPYHPGDILAYRADRYDESCTPWRPSIHMPKEAARIFLRVTGGRVERLQEITEDEAIREGCIAHGGNLAIDDFRAIWDSTIKKADLPLYGWDANPWVWVIEFERIERPEGE